MRLEQMEHEAREQQGEADELTKEAEENKRQAEELRTMTDKLWEAHSDLGSDELRTAIETSQEAERDLERRREELTEKKAELLERNRELTEKCEQGIKKKKAALEWGVQIADSLIGTLPRGGARDLFMKQTVSNVEQAIGRAEGTRDDLQIARELLKSVDL